MKIADSESIKAGEQELISSIMNRLDSETLARVATKQLSPDMMEFVHGDMVIRDGQIVYKMDFKATLDISVTFDRDGELVLSDGIEEGGEPMPQDSEDGLMEAALDDAGVSDEPEDSGKEDLAAEMQGSDASQDLEDDLTEVFSRNRNFWNRKSEAAVTEMDTGSERSDSMDE